MGTESDLRWFILRTLPQREIMSAKILRHMGLIAEVPREPRMRRQTKWDKERKSILYPSMPGYIFYATECAPREIPWHTVFKLHLIRSVVSINGVPALIDQSAVEHLLQSVWAVEPPAYAKFLRTGKEFDVGDMVFITNGPLRDFELRVQDIQEGEAHFIIPLLGKQQLVRISIDHCMKAA